MRNRTAEAILATLAALLLAGCGEPRPDGDSPDLDAFPPLTLVEDLRLGSRDDPDAGFSRVGRIEVDARGRLYVFELLDLQFRVYDPSGRQLHRFGGRGGGPGEFESAPRFGLRGDTLWTVGSFSRRVTLLDTEGRVLGTGRYEQVPVVMQAPATSLGIVVPRLLTSDGHFLGDLSLWVGGSSAPSPPPGDHPGEADTLRVPIVRYDARGAVVDTAGWYPYPPREISPRSEFEFRSTRYRLPGPPGDWPYIVLLEDGHLQVERRAPRSEGDAVVAFTRRTLQGDTVYHREYRYAPVEYGEARLDAIAWSRVRSPTGAVPMVGGLAQTPAMLADSLERFRAVRARLEYPPYQPPVTDVHLGSDGTLWIRREDAGGPDFRWVALDRDGLPLGSLELPRNHQLAWASREAVWIVAPDELDVPWLVRYRIVPDDGR